VDFPTTCAQAGLDLVAYAPLAALNAAVAPAHRLPGAADALAAVVGNSRAFWDPFVDALVDDPALAASDAPLDAYVEAVVGAAAGDRALVRFAHRQPFPPIRAFAEAAGLATAGASMLCVHPVHGPWIALRAVVVFDAPAPPDLVVARAPACGACDDACGPLFSIASGARDRRAYLAARDACPVGRASRYGDAQLAYHYTGDRRVLFAEVARRRAARA